MSDFVRPAWIPPELEIPEWFPVLGDRDRRSIPRGIQIAAYEVYRELYTDQWALLTVNCRGGFDALELVNFLYLRNFPKDQWRDIHRVMSLTLHGK
jgi:hypothetical protein